MVKQKRKRKREERPIVRWDKQPIWINVLIGEGILAFCATGRAYHFSRNMLLPPIVIGIWTLGAILLGQYANAHDAETNDVLWRNRSHTQRNQY